MRIIYCDSVLDPKLIEPDYEEELQAAKTAGFDYSLISFEELTDGNVTKALRFVKVAEEKIPGIYRGWMLRPAQYQLLYEGLLAKNIELINSPSEYTHCHYLPESYGKIQTKTAESVWTTNLNKEAMAELLKAFGESPIIVKDYVKSEKHHWEEACFIPNASDTSIVFSVVDRFLELRGSSLNEGLVFRKFEKLEYLSQHAKSGMPLTKEFRIFFAKQQVLTVFDYWEDGDYGESKAELAEFMEIAKGIESNFFTMDVAKKTDGSWMIMELGDGQVAGLPYHANKQEFYKNLAERI